MSGIEIGGVNTVGGSLKIGGVDVLGLIKQLATELNATQNKLARLETYHEQLEVIVEHRFIGAYCEIEQTPEAAVRYSIGSLEAALYVIQKRLEVAWSRCRAAEQELRDANLELHEARQRSRELEKALADARKEAGNG